MIKKIPKRIKNNKIIYILTIILLLLLGGIIFLNKINHSVEEKHNQDITKYYFKDSKYNGISSKFIERKNSKEDAILEIPVTKNNKINEFINNKIQEIDETFKDDAKKSTFENISTERISYQVYYNNDDAISILISIKQDTHGANLNDQNLFWTFNAKNGEIIKFSDFLNNKEKDKSNILEIIKNKIRDYLKNSKKEFSNEILNDLDFESFENIIILDKQTIDFPFSKGQIIPSNFSSVQFQIKVSEISNFLQNDFSRKIFEVPDVQNSKQVQKTTPLTSKSPLLDKDCSKCIALTFDDGPGIYTDKLLSYLQSYKAKATFFMIGPSAQRYPSIVKRVFDNGHQIGNHTWSHPSLPGLSPEQVQKEISSTNNILQGITGVKPTTLRPPYGATNAAVQRVVSNLGMSSILWSIDTRDWADRNSNIVCNRAISNARPGAIILMHDIHQTSVEAVPCILQNLSSQGYQFVTVDKLLGNLQSGHIYYSAR